MILITLIGGLVLPLLIFAFAFLVGVLLWVIEKIVKRNNKRNAKRLQEIQEQLSAMKTLDDRESSKEKAKLITNIIFLYSSVVFTRMLAMILKLVRIVNKWLRRLLLAFNIVNVLVMSMVIGVLVSSVIATSIAFQNSDLSIFNGNKIDTTTNSRRNTFSSSNVSGIVKKVMEFDWGQDLHSAIEKVAKKYYANDSQRYSDFVNYLHFSRVIQYITQENLSADEKAFEVIPGMIMGQKNVESGRSSPPLQSKLDDYFNKEFNHGSLCRNIKGDWDSVYNYQSQGLNGCRDGDTSTGFFQMDTHWEDFNPRYTNYKLDMRKQHNGIPNYLPDAIIGLHNAYTNGKRKILDPEKQKQPIPRMIRETYQKMGLSPTDEQLQTISLMTFPVLSYGTVYNLVYDARYGTRGTEWIDFEVSKQMTEKIIMTMIIFNEYYGYGYGNENHIKLFQAIKKHNEGKDITKDRFALIMYGVSSMDKYQSVENTPAKNENFGVIDPQGREVIGPVLHHMLENYDGGKYKKEIVGNSIYERYTNKANGWHWRGKYDLTAYMMALQDLNYLYEITQEK